MRSISPQFQKKKFYADIAYKFGTIVRDNIISSNKKKRVNSLRSMDLLEDLKKSRVERRKDANIQKRILITSHKNYREEKKEMIEGFKQKLKRSLDQSRLRNEEKTNELVNKVRWRKTLMLKNRQQKISEYKENKKRQIQLMREQIEIRKSEHERKKLQQSLESTFEKLERKLRSQHY